MLKMMNFVLTMMNFGFQMMDFVLKMMNSGFEMMNSVLKRMILICSLMALCSEPLAEYVGARCDLLIYGLFIYGLFVCDLFHL